MEEHRKSRGRVAGASEKQITLRRDDEIIAKFPESDKGRQGRMNKALRNAAGSAS